MGVSALIVMVVSIALSFLLIYVPNMHIIALKIRDKEMEGGRVSIMEMLLDENQLSEEVNQDEVVDILMGHEMRLSLPSNVSTRDVSIKNDYVNRTISVTIKGIGKDYFNQYPMRGLSNNIMDITYGSENLVGVIDIVLDDVKELKMEENGPYLYFDFIDPKDVYDYVVVVDAGHGGNVPGASKMGINEKDLNLDIVLELKKLLDKNDKNIGVYYTRTRDVNPSFENRVGLANDSDADLFLSVHNNSTASGRMSSISGAEVMYRGGDESGESKKFSQMCLDNLLSALGAKSKGLVVGDEVYIIRTSQVPVALVEVGFMTNQTELQNLSDKTYQKKAAQALYDSIIEYLNTREMQ